jgi:hypothetical protein
MRQPGLLSIIGTGSGGSACIVVTTGRGAAMNTAKILSEYFEGDADTRMSIFLYYRELRDLFAKIDERGELLAADAPDRV